MGEGAAPSVRALEAEEGAKRRSRLWQHGGVVWLGATRGAGDVCAGQADVWRSGSSSCRWSSGGSDVTGPRLRVVPLPSNDVLYV
jgi:hypothetical protein